jgi:hypothetical protein
MKDITVLLYWTNMREITSYWFDVQKRTHFKQLFCATCRIPHSYLTYVQFAAGIMSYFLFHGIKLLNIFVSIVKYNNNDLTEDTQSLVKPYTHFMFICSTWMHTLHKLKWVRVVKLLNNFWTGTIMYLKIWN